MAINRSSIARIFSQYVAHYPDEAGYLQSLETFIDGNSQLISRKNFNGHITASGIVLSPDLSAMLMIKHNIIQKYFQPGGHVELSDESIIDANRREIAEETGINNLDIIQIDSKNADTPFDIDIHLIPANPKKNEKAHFHHDFRYLFIANETTLTPHNDEVSDCLWVPINHITEIGDYIKVQTKLYTAISNLK